MIKAALIGVGVYLAGGLICVGILTAGVMVSAAIQTATQSAGTGILLYTLLFLLIAFFPIVWFFGSPILAGFLSGSKARGALAAGSGFGVTIGITAMGAMIFYTVEEGVNAILKGANDWWAPWILLIILSGGWVVGILISAVLGFFAGAARDFFRPSRPA
jgi:hypothetical protein